ncbi:uncharacterized protein SCHCODRAFT_02493114 [Schizophyllum commune H4-8]|nr:uncharacterized protein SCHCODRAFT_02493114 [Schizophyllum commune H4-8]KAI5896077.1 hypothetical protein SCHCODRAFT_02493114 [Schizophyllum commune H4-8]
MLPSSWKHAGGPTASFATREEIADLEPPEPHAGFPGENLSRLGFPPSSHSDFVAGGTISNVVNAFEHRLGRRQAAGGTSAPTRRQMRRGWGTLADGVECEKEGDDVECEKEGDGVSSVADDFSKRANRRRRTPTRWARYAAGVLVEPDPPKAREDVFHKEYDDDPEPPEARACSLDGEREEGELPSSSPSPFSSRTSPPHLPPLPAPLPLPSGSSTLISRRAPSTRDSQAWETEEACAMWAGIGMWGEGTHSPSRSACFSVLTILQVDSEREAVRLSRALRQCPCQRTFVLVGGALARGGGKRDVGGGGEAEREGKGGRGGLETAAALLKKTEDEAQVLGVVEKQG